ncbi:hypothetical protein [Mycobacterium sp. 1274761.0]|uniref:hypothetical protein n=1 Tax=Mycobacterium sp. 1274761.0 TaxID=1834077 RepID=UPI000801ECD6|nr:hypothetical protein [Mycobacterium sp. 1274761.0]OBK70459.1 hypothetical protein A5651_21635 [Mycobacterium sp. 1274761.0]
MNTIKKTAAGAVLGGALLAAGGFGLAQAAPQPESVVNDEKVNVTVTADNQEIGVLQNLTLDKAQTLVASACPNGVGITPEALNALDANGTPVPLCTSPEGLSFAFVQNSPGNSENTPARQNGAMPSSPSSPSSPSPAPDGSR